MSGPRGEGWRLGDYEVGGELGRGTMGVVYRARDARLQREVALKVMLGAGFANRNERARFQAEAEIAASLDHPGIVPIYGVGEADGVPYFAMRRVEGRTLDRWWIDERHSGDCAMAVRIVATIARAVEHAHQRGVLHRDLKPGNILVDADGQPHITDFGLARRVEMDARGTVAGTPVGTPAYMAPEQATGSRDVSVAADIWSLGAMLHELAVGAPPFHGANLADLLQRIVAGDRQPWPASGGRRVSKGRWRDLGVVVGVCLDRDPARRYASAGAFANDLERWLRDEPVSARPVSLRERGWRWIRRNPALAISVGLGAAAGVAGAAGVGMQTVRARESARVAQRALADTQAALWQASFDRARALRMAREPGQRLKALESIATAISFRADPALRGEWAAASDLYDLEDPGTFQPLPPDAAHLAVDSDLRRYAVARSTGEIEVRDFDHGRVLVGWAAGNPVATLMFANEGRWLLAHSRAGDVLWDASDGRVIRRMSGHVALAVNPDGRWMVSRNEQGGGIVRDLATGAEVCRLGGEGHDQYLFSPDSRWLAARSANRVEIWSIPAGSLAARLEPVVTGLSMSWHPGSRQLAIGCEDTQLLLWEPELRTDGPVTGVPSVGAIHAFAGHTREGVWPLFDPRGELIASRCWDGWLRLWDVAAREVAVQTRSMMPIGFSADGEWLAVHDAGRLARWRVHRPDRDRWLRFDRRPDSAPSAMVFSPGSERLAAIRARTEVGIWDLESGNLGWRRELAGACGVGWTTAGGFTVVDHAGIHQWRDFQSATRAPSDPPSAWQPIAPDPEQALVLAGGVVVVRYPGRIEVHRPGMPTPRVLPNQHAFAADVAASPDGGWLAIGAWNNAGNFGGELHIRSMETGQVAQRWMLGNCGGHFSPDGRHFLAASVSTMVLHEIRGAPVGWPVVQTLERRVSDFVRGKAAFSGDGRYLAVPIDNRTIRLIDLTTASERIRLTPMAESVDELALSGDGRWLAAGTPRGIRVWDLRQLRALLKKQGIDWDDPIR